MNNNLSVKRSAISHYFDVVAFAVMGVFVGALLMTTFLSLVATSVDPVTTMATEVSTTVVVADPQTLTIPAVGITTPFAGSLGLNEDGTVAVPDSYDAVGWYRFGPKPGELGPAVILGHVDSYKGPAVFFDLQKVSVGDEVFIEREDGSVATFVVTEVEYRRQSAFPTEAVYGDIDHAGLRLITCSGQFDHGRQVYSHNLIAYAALVTDTAQ